jgi:two-component system, NarL family, sensor histidine kinase UhpB
MSEATEQTSGSRPPNTDGRAAMAEDARVFPRTELRIVVAYLVGATLWVVGSDWALDWLTKDPVHSLQLQTVKGVNFVFTTALLLYVVLRRVFIRWRRTERRLREAQERFEFAARAATDAIADWNVRTGELWWSEGFYTLFGYSREEVAPTIEWCLERLHPEDKTRALGGLERALATGQGGRTNEYRFRRQDGQYAVVHVRAYVLHDPAGRLLRMVGAVSDITASKLAAAKLESSRRQLRSLSARLQSLREEERTRIAREIHDELGQTLTGLKMDLRWAERRLAKHPSPALNPVLDKVVGAGELVDATIASVQRIAAELRPSLLEDLGLSAALQQEARRFQERAGVVCEVVVPDLPRPLSMERATAVFRIFQEALTNVARHAAATQVRVELMEEGPSGERLVLRVADNGRGINAADLDDPKSLGLLGMRERAEMLGGEVAFQPGTPHGTVVTLRLPREGGNSVSL